jgi:hypothetical protein
MIILILTRGRVDKQITLSSIPDSLLPNTYIVCPASEVEAHVYKGRQCIAQPDHVRGISAKRQWLIENAKELFGETKLFMLDDDLSFNVRIAGTVKLRKFNHKEELREAFEHLYAMLDLYALVGVSTRQGNNNEPADYAENTRILRFFGMDTAKVGDAKFGRVELMEDYDFQLQLLRAGKKNYVLYKFCQDQPASGSVGGCSDYRTKELQELSAHKLKELHPEFVRVTMKQPKNGWEGMGERTDVTIYWKKAYKSYGG